MRFEKCLLSCMTIGAMKRRTAGHRTHHEYLHFRTLSVKIDVDFVPIHLRFLTHAVALRDKRLSRGQPHLPLTFAHVVADRGSSHRSVRKFAQNSPINPPRCVPLLARCPPVSLQNRADERHDRRQLWLGTQPIVVWWWHRTGQRLADQSAMNTEFCRNPGNRADPKLMLPTELLEQVQFGSPIHARVP
jgi:hypothetical protein